jgi:hypothetical protein
VRDPSTRVEIRLGEGLVELQFLAGAIERNRVRAAVWAHIVAHVVSLSAGISSTSAL